MCGLYRERQVLLSQTPPLPSYPSTNQEGCIEDIRKEMTLPGKESDTAE